MTIWRMILDGAGYGTGDVSFSETSWQDGGNFWCDARASISSGFGGGFNPWQDHDDDGSDGLGAGEPDNYMAREHGRKNNGDGMTHGR